MSIRLPIGQEEKITIPRNHCHAFVDITPPSPIFVQWWRQYRRIEIPVTRHLVPSKITRTDTTLWSRPEEWNVFTQRCWKISIRKGFFFNSVILNGFLEVRQAEFFSAFSSSVLCFLTHKYVFCFFRNISFSFRPLHECINNIPLALICLGKISHVISEWAWQKKIEYSYSEIKGKKRKEKLRPIAETKRDFCCMKSWSNLQDIFFYLIRRCRNYFVLLFSTLSTDIQMYMLFFVRFSPDNFRLLQIYVYSDNVSVKK